MEECCLRWFVVGHCLNSIIGNHWTRSEHYNHWPPFSGAAGRPLLCHFFQQPNIKNRSVNAQRNAAAATRTTTIIAITRSPAISWWWWRILPTAFSSASLTAIGTCRHGHGHRQGHTLVISCEWTLRHQLDSSSSSVAVGRYALQLPNGCGGGFFAITVPTHFFDTRWSQNFGSGDVKRVWLIFGRNYDKYFGDSVDRSAAYSFY